VGFLSPTNYGKIIRFLKVSGFNAMEIALVCLNMVPTGHTEPTGHYGCSRSQSGHFGGSSVMEPPQSFENSQKSAFCQSLVVDMSMSLAYWLARVETVWSGVISG
jgi:hypothetical protein